MVAVKAEQKDSDGNLFNGVEAWSSGYDLAEGETQEIKLGIPHVDFYELEFVDANGGVWAAGEQAVITIEGVYLVVNATASWAQEGNTDKIPLEKIPQRPDGINELPSPLVVGQRYVLLQTDRIHHDREFQALQAQPTLRTVLINSRNVNGICTYSAGYSGTNAAALRNKVFFAPIDNTLETATKLVLYEEGGARTEHNIASSFIPGETHRYLVDGLTYASLVTGTAYVVNVVYQDNSELFPTAVYEPGDWIADSTNSLVHTPGSAAPWAEFGNDSTMPEDKLPFETEEWAKVGNNDSAPPTKFAQFMTHAQYTAIQNKNTSGLIFTTTSA